MPNDTPTERSAQCARSVFQVTHMTHPRKFRCVLPPTNERRSLNHLAFRSVRSAGVSLYLYVTILAFTRGFVRDKKGIRM